MNLAAIFRDLFATIQTYLKDQTPISVPATEPISPPAATSSPATGSATVPPPVRPATLEEKLDALIAHENGVFGPSPKTGGVIHAIDSAKRAQIARVIVQVVASTQVDSGGVKASVPLFASWIKGESRFDDGAYNPNTPQKFGAKLTPGYQSVMTRTIATVVNGQTTTRMETLGEAFLHTDWGLGQFDGKELVGFPDLAGMTWDQMRDTALDAAWAITAMYETCNGLLNWGRTTHANAVAALVQEQHDRMNAIQAVIDKHAATDETEAAAAEQEYERLVNLPAVANVTAVGLGLPRAGLRGVQRRAHRSDGNRAHRLRIRRGRRGSGRGVFGGFGGAGMIATIDPVRWAQIESLPLPTGVGDLENGLCAFARIVYAATGEVSDLSDLVCVAPSVRSYVIRLNIRLPESLRQGLGTLALAERILAADTSQPAEQKRAYIYADYAVRRFAPISFRKAGLIAEAEKLESLKRGRGRFDLQNGSNRHQRLQIRPLRRRRLLRRILRRQHRRRRRRLLRRRRRLGQKCSACV